MASAREIMCIENPFLPNLSRSDFITSSDQIDLIRFCCEWRSPQPSKSLILFYYRILRQSLDSATIAFATDMSDAEGSVRCWTPMICP
jgi:hypothetical protein